MALVNFLQRKLLCFIILLLLLQGLAKPKQRCALGCCFISYGNHMLILRGERRLGHHKIQTTLSPNQILRCLLSLNHAYLTVLIS